MPVPQSNVWVLPQHARSVTESGTTSNTGQGLKVATRCDEDALLNSPKPLTTMRVLLLSAGVLLCYQPLGTYPS